MQSRARVQCSDVLTILVLLAWFGGMGLPGAVWGQTDHLWDGGSATSNAISAPLNWSNNTLPANGGTGSVEFPDSPRATPVAILAWDFFGIIFSGDATPYSLSGIAMQLGPGGVVSLSPKLQTISNDITLTSNQSWGAIVGPLVLNGQVIGSKQLTLLGGNDYVFNNNMTGVLNMQGSGRLTLAGTSNLSDLNVLTGELRIDTDQPIFPGQFVDMSDGTRFSATGTRSCDMGVSITGNVTYGAGNLAIPLFSGGLADTLTLVGPGELEIQGGSFNGRMHVERGKLIANRTTPFLVSELLVGTGSGTPPSATVRLLAAQQFLSSTQVHLLSDGWMDIQVGTQSLSAITLTGGQVTGTQLEVGTITGLASSRTASVDCDWSSTGAANLDIANGVADPDLEVTGNVVVPAGQGIKKFRPGSVRFSGATLGPTSLTVFSGEVRIATTGQSAALDSVEVGEDSEILIETSDQLGPSCGLRMEPGTSMTLLAHTQIGTLNSDGDGVGIHSTSAVLELMESPHNFAGASTSTLINAPIRFSAVQSQVVLQEGAVVDFRKSVTANFELRLTGAGSAQVSALTVDANQLILDGVELRVTEINGHLDQRAGTFSPKPFGGSTGTATIDGDWTQSGGDVEIEFTGGLGVSHDQVVVTETVSLGGTLTILLNTPLPNGAIYPLVSGNSIAGAFSTVSVVPLPADQGILIAYFPDRVEMWVLETVTSVPEPAPEQIERSPKSFALAQNVPNPFNPRTSIGFQLPRVSTVQLQVFDATGRRVLSVAPRNYEPGTHQYIWDGRDDSGREVAGGLYFYRLQAGSFQQTRKMVLVR